MSSSTEPHFRMRPLDTIRMIARRSTLIGGDAPGVPAGRPRICSIRIMAGVLSPAYVSSPWVRAAAELWKFANPRILVVSLAAILLAWAAAAADGPIGFGWLVLVLAIIALIEIGRNASEEIFLLRPGETRARAYATATAAYILGCSLGLLVCGLREPRAFWFGFCGVALSFLYNAPPFRLSSRGYGEAIAAVVFGPLICSGMFFVLRGTFSMNVALASLPLGLFIGACLWISRLPAAAARHGRKAARGIFAGFIASGIAISLLLPFFGLPRGVSLGSLAAVPALLAVFGVSPGWDRSLTFAALFVYALGAGAGLLLRV